MSGDNPMKPPPRLLDDASVDAELHEGLAELAASELPFDSVAGLAALKSALHGASEAGFAASGAASASASASAGATPWLAGGLALALLGGGVYALWPQPPSARSAAPAPAASARAPAAPAPEPVLPAPSRVVPAPQPEPARELTPVPSATRAGAPAPIEREVALTVRAKALVDHSPRAALALLRRLDREHPSGALAEERAGLRVLALWQAGEHARAEHERDAFLTRYPQSPLRERLARLGEAP